MFVKRLVVVAFLGAVLVLGTSAAWATTLALLPTGETAMPVQDSWLSGTIIAEKVSPY